jgi:hypothetical protein
MQQLKLIVLKVCSSKTLYFFLASFFSMIMKRLISVKKITNMIVVILICLSGADALLNTDLEKDLSLQDGYFGIVRTAVLPENVSLDAEEYAVLSALIEKIYSADKNKSMPILIRDYTDFPEQMTDSLSKRLKSLQQIALEDLTTKNSRKFKLMRQFNLSSKYLLVNEQDNPGVEGILGFSRVGFNEGKTQALVHVDEIRRWYVSDSFLVLLEKENGGWKVEEEEMTCIGE